MQGRIRCPPNPTSASAWMQTRCERRRAAVCGRVGDYPRMPISAETGLSRRTIRVCRSQSRRESWPAAGLGIWELGGAITCGSCGEVALLLQLQKALYHTRQVKSGALAMRPSFLSPDRAQIQIEDERSGSWIARLHHARHPPSKIPSPTSASVQRCMRNIADGLHDGK